MMRIDLGLKRNAVFACKVLLRSLLACTLLGTVAAAQVSNNSWQDQVSEADALRVQWNAGAWRKALQKYRAALTRLRGASLQREEARVLRLIGLVHLALGENTLALQNLTSSVSLLKQLKISDAEFVDTLNDIANTHIRLGNKDHAQDFCKDSLDLSRSLSYVKGEGTALELSGQVEYDSGDQTRSIDLYNSALAILKQTNDDASLAQTYLDLGYSYSDLHETDNARRALDQALVLWRSARNPRGEALTLTALGHLHSKLGEKQQALDLYHQSIQLLEPLEDRVAMAFNFDGLGFTNASLGERSTALQEYTKSLELFSQANIRYGEPGALCKIAELHIVNEDYATALDYLHRSLALSQSIGDPRMQAIATAFIGHVRERQNQLAGALQLYNQALLLHRRGKDNREEAYTLNSIGRVHEALGQRDKAFDSYTQALALNRATGDRFGESGTLYRLARLEQSLGKLNDAKLHGEQSIALVESLRAGVASHDLRSSYVATVHQLYELYIDILMSLHAADPPAGFDKAALEASEAGRARTLLETLAEAKTQIREGVDPKLLERERALQIQLEALATRQVKSTPAVESEIEQVTAEYRDIQGQIRARSPQYAALVQPVTLKTKQIQELLEPGTLLLEYSLGEKRSFLWAVTSDSLQSYELPPQSGIEAAAQKLYAAVTSTSNTYENDARSVSSLLFGRMHDLSTVKRLVIVADGALQYIPYAALPEPDHAEKLVSRYEIVRLHSASVLAIQRTQFAHRSPAPKSVAVLADPVFDNTDPRVLALRDARRNSSTMAVARNSRALRDAGLIVNGRIQRLMFSSAEADAVYAAASPNDSLKAVGFKASRATVTDPELSQYKFIHIASHGVLDSKHPEFSGILLSMIDETGRPVSGFLQLHEIYNLKLPAELVVLSACETGIGKQIRGEGLIALTRGFMHAGAARVVATLWKVDDAATAALMAQFYKEMFTNHKRPAEALQAAQISISSNKRWRDPYYWAGFVLQGEWR